MLQKYVVDPNQQQEYSFVFDKDNSADHAHLSFDIASDAVLIVYILIVDVDIDITINCHISGKQSDVRINGAYLLSGDHKATITTMQHHHNAYTRSALVMKGALKDCAQVQYRGTIRVEKEARGTHASQENKNILLSNSARAVSVPNLEVLNNDVKCFHGSAVGRFDAQQLFYAACRGIDEKTAEKMLLTAFFENVIRGDTNGKIKRLIDGF